MSPSFNPINQVDLRDTMNSSAKSPQAPFVSEATETVEQAAVSILVVAGVSIWVYAIASALSSIFDTMALQIFPPLE